MTPFPETLQLPYVGWQPTGSRFIAPESATDESDSDYLVFVNIMHDDYADNFSKRLNALGFTPHTGTYETEEPDSPDFTSWRLAEGNLNLMVTYDLKWFNAMVAATLEAQAVRAATRPERVAIFQKHEREAGYRV